MRSLKASQSRPSIIAVIGVGCFVPQCGRGTGELVETIPQWMRSHMTLHPKNEWIISAETARVARAAFAKGNIYMSATSLGSSTLIKQVILTEAQKDFFFKQSLVQ